LLPVEPAGYRQNQHEPRVDGWVPSADRSRQEQVINGGESGAVTGVNQVDRLFG
jgi:hypothetical protein